MNSYKANTGATDQMLPPKAGIQVINQLLDIQLVRQNATDTEKTAGKLEGDLTFGNILKSFDSSAAFDQRLKATSMTADELHAQAI